MTIRPTIRPILAVLVLLLLAGATSAGDWPQFRGPDGRGISDDTGVPIHWGPNENVRWKADLPGRGLSCPVVARGRVYVTACTGRLQDRLHVLCFDAASGKKQWERQLWATGNTMCNPKSCMAAPTPVTDGERVYALFATGDLVCFDAAGDLLWYRALAQDYPHITNQVGLAASPIVWDDVLILPMDNVVDSFAAGLDKFTGCNRWRVDRPRDITWPTPLLFRHDGRTAVLFLSGRDLTAYEPATGQKLWDYHGPGLSAIPSAVAADGLVVLPNGAALRPAPYGSPEVVWKTARLHPAYATPLVYKDRVYVINSSTEILHVAELPTGKVLRQLRLKGSFSASPVLAEGRLYLVNEDGLTLVVEAVDEPRIVASNPLGEKMLATPAVAGGAIYLRSDQHLFCIASGKR
jgi:outer membrane protein assembly factor BamB